MRPKIKIRLFLILGVTLFWMASGAFLAFYKCVNYIPELNDFAFIVPNKLSFSSFLLINILGPAFGGFLGGSILILSMGNHLRKKSYWYYVLVNFFFLLIFIFVLNVAVPYFFYYHEEINSSEDSFTKALQLLILDPYALRNLVTWLIIAWLTIQGLNLYEKYAPTTLVSLLLGRFHHPREIQRIFMFLDLSSSTTIAEKLGHVRFFALLKDFFANMTDAILDSQGEIYQYVGDEIVISWPVRKNILKFAQPLACFFRIEESLAKQKDYYLQEYGIFPIFKAAIHLGPVVVGEMGIIKKEIVYSGDILNTTSRMMEQCNVFNQKLIISEDILKSMPEEQIEQYTSNFLADMTLRGKSQHLKLFAINRATLQL